MQYPFVLPVLFAVSVSGCASQTNAQQPDSRPLQKSQQAALSPLHKKASLEIAKLRTCKITAWSIPGGFGILELRSGKEAPAQALYDMGIDVLPVLVEALTDATPTTVVDGPSGKLHDETRKVWQVNELVWLLIHNIAAHHFVIEDPAPKVVGGVITGPGGVKESPEMIPQYQQLVLDWYQKNRNRTPIERKIADVDDAFFRNRLDAVEWLAQQKVVAAEPAILGYAERTLRFGHGSSMIDAELEECAMALGQIGGKNSLPTVRKVCKYLVEGRDGPYSQGFGDQLTLMLFNAHHGMALLGAKDEALRELHALYAKHQAKASERDKKEYQEALKEAAAQW